MRGFALLAGVALHLTLSWLPGAQYWWIVGETDTSLVFTPDDFPLTHLWFLYVLTLCYAAMPMLGSDRLCVRHGFIGAMLNGRNARRRSGLAR